MPEPRTNGEGHNSGLTDDQRSDLIFYYARHDAPHEAEIDKLSGALKAVRKLRNANFKRMTADLTIPRYKFEEYLAARKMDEEEFVEAEAERHRLFSLGGLPVGAQTDLFEHAKADTVDDQVRARAAGKRAYWANQECTPPQEIAPIMHQEWIAGWNEGMEEVGARMARANAIIEARGQPNTDADTVDLNGGQDGEGDEEIDPDNVDLTKVFGGEGEAPTGEDDDELSTAERKLVETGFAPEPKSRRRRRTQNLAA